MARPLIREYQNKIVSGSKVSFYIACTQMLDNAHDILPHSNTQTVTLLPDTLLFRYSLI